MLKMHKRLRRFYRLLSNREKYYYSLMEKSKPDIFVDSPDISKGKVI